MCIWRPCNKDPSASLGMTVLGERIGSQGWCATFLEDGILVSQPSPLGKVPEGRIGCYRMKDNFAEKEICILFLRSCRQYPSAAGPPPFVFSPITFPNFLPPCDIIGKVTMNGFYF